MDGVRRRLAPIRGIPTKVGGMGGGLRGGWWRSCCNVGWVGESAAPHPPPSYLAPGSGRLFALCHCLLDTLPASSAAPSLPPLAACVPSLQSGGMQDPNADFKEIFDIIEAIPSAPKKLMDGIGRWFRWARGCRAKLGRRCWACRGCLGGPGSAWLASGADQRLCLALACLNRSGADDPDWKKKK